MSTNEMQTIWGVEELIVFAPFQFPSHFLINQLDKSNYMEPDYKTKNTYEKCTGEVLKHSTKANHTWESYKG